MEYSMMMRMMMVMMTMIIRMMFQPSEIIQVTSCHIDDGDFDASTTMLANLNLNYSGWGCTVSSQINIDLY